MTAPQAEQQINDMLKSLLDTTSKTGDSHFGHLGSDIFILRGYDYPHKRGGYSLIYYTTHVVFIKEAIRAVQQFSVSSRPPSRRRGGHGEAMISINGKSGTLV